MNLLKNFIAKFRDARDPTTKLTAISFGLIFAAAIIIGSSISYYLSHQVRNNNAAIISQFVKLYVNAHFRESDFDYKGADVPLFSNGNFNDELLEIKSILKATMMKVVDPSGRIIWSDNEKVTKNIDSNKHKKALKNKNSHGVVKVDAAAFDNGSKKLYYVTIPVTFPNSDQVKAVFEIYKNHYAGSNGIYIGWVIIWLFTICGGGIIHFIFARAIKRTYQQNRILQYELIEYSHELESNIQVITDIQNVAILGLSKLAEYRDKETGLHLERMSLYSKLLAEELSKWEKYKFRITRGYIDSLFTSSVLHDIGKVGIPDRVLLKPGKLIGEEWETMMKHTTIGGDALAAADKALGIESFLTVGKEVAYYHHEKYNGKGYPFGKKGEEIPLSARIVAFADVFDALTSVRVYKPAFDFEKTKGILLEGRGEHFAPDMVEAFLSIEKDFFDISDKYQ